ncbi:MAG: ribose-5-phosphate isomerase RpiA [Gemmatimonadetes bacterium]|nr:ribose-5-phosphate isomerase RpiA [Gemmatimonadota bacterium]NIR77872.1 ribose-5-phosphate isomerase RpiA [Gemmatimonadota bacterium]NIT86417.1 ribose-5-phosphate isomerase RpiA [Gemmatimonadota bacterium]NIU30254.1 ribose-5-phosphate isomerase RpiA [Gemmatimonadota bacterium]NIU35160.1 ribose-5-phosphate isomerase RpiA [Gemmatimonadota bacterium]
MTDRDASKRAAATEAVERVRSGMVLGLGTGSTTAHFLELLAARIDEGALERVAGVPTSERTASAARSLGIPLTTLDRAPALDLAVDGADEVDPGLDLIKGLGGALLREKIVAQAARRLVIVVDDSKLVERLGERGPLPVEVIPFGWQRQREFARGLGADAELRADGPEEPYVTDNGNYVLDCRFHGGIDDPVGVHDALRARAGIVETGLFLKMASEVVVGGAAGVRSLCREEEGGGP